MLRTHMRQVGGLRLNGLQYAATMTQEEFDGLAKGDIVRSWTKSNPPSMAALYYVLDRWDWDKVEKHAPK